MKYELKVQLSLLLQVNENQIATKGLIVDYIPFEVSPEQILESIKTNDGKLINRPILVVNESKLIIGYDQSEYEANF